MRTLFAVGLIAVIACGPSKGRGDDDGDGGNNEPDACVGGVRMRPRCTMKTFSPVPSATLPCSLSRIASS